MCLIFIYNIFIDLASLANFLLNSPLSNFVEHCATRILQSQGLFQGPCDKLTLTIRVWSQVYFVSMPGSSFQFVNQLIFFLDDFILGSEIFARVYAKALFGQVYDMPHGGAYLTVLSSEIFY